VLSVNILDNVLVDDFRDRIGFMQTNGRKYSSIEYTDASHKYLDSQLTKGYLVSLVIGKSSTRTNTVSINYSEY